MELTGLLNAANRGDAAAHSELYRRIQDPLRRIASNRLARFGGAAGHTLQPTCLVNDAYVQLIGKRGTEWEGRDHFFKSAGTVIFRLLVDYRRHLFAKKRAGDRVRLELDPELDLGDRLPMPAPGSSEHHFRLDLQEALEFLRRSNGRAARVFEERYFNAMTIAEVAESLNLSHGTVERDYDFARKLIAIRLGMT